MTSLSAARDTIAQVVAEVEAAESVHQEAIGIARDRTNSSRQGFVQEDDALERFLLDARARSESALARARQMLSTLRLTTPAEGRYTIPQDISRDQMSMQIQQLVALCDELVREIQLNADSLLAERRKWWKFW